jgi:hypothetical protein
LAHLLAMAGLVKVKMAPFVFGDQGACAFPNRPGIRIVSGDKEATVALEVSEKLRFAQMGQVHDLPIGTMTGLTRA